MLEPTQLPQLDDEARRTSDMLSKRIRQTIESSNGHIGFDDFMQLALYEPGLGYYAGAAEKFGRDGDFITAPELSPMFGASVARQCQEVLLRTKGEIFEFGAGAGHLAANVLLELANLDSLPTKYTILELNAQMRERQCQTIKAVAPEQLNCTQWVSELPKRSLSGVILANEIVDALPAKAFKTRGGSILERRVCVNDHQFAWQDVPAGPALKAQITDRVSSEIINSNDAYVSEINLTIEPWINDLSHILENGLGLIFDYGHVRSEYYRPDRTNGTLHCHYRHRAHGDPFWSPGLQDITASVDFTAIAEAADAAGLHVAGFVDQANFLLGCDLLVDAERRATRAGAADLARLAHETKVLTLPTEMGTRFKVLALTKGYNHGLRGFQIRDDRHRL